MLLWGSGLIRLLPGAGADGHRYFGPAGAVEFDMAHRLLRADRKELAIFLAAFLGVLVLGTIYGVVIGVLLSFVDVIRRPPSPAGSCWGSSPGSRAFTRWGA